MKLALFLTLNFLLLTAAQAATITDSGASDSNGALLDGVPISFHPIAAHVTGPTGSLVSGRSITNYYSQGAFSQSLVTGGYLVIVGSSPLGFIAVPNDSLTHTLASVGGFLTISGSGGIDASNVISGILLTNRLPGYLSGWSLIPTNGSAGGNIDASNVVSGVLLTNRLPGFLSGWSLISTGALGTQITNRGVIIGQGNGSVLSRTNAAGSARITISNPDGIAGNPTFDAQESAFLLQDLGGLLLASQGPTNTATSYGWVAPGTGFNGYYWATDNSGNPGWRLVGMSGTLTPGLIPYATGAHLLADGPIAVLDSQTVQVPKLNVTVQLSVAGDPTKTNYVGGAETDFTNAVKIANGGLTTTTANISQTNFVSEEILTNGVTLGGVRITSWPAAGAGSYQPASANLTNWSVIATNNIGAIGAQPTNSTLTSWAGIAPSTKENQSANLDNWSTISTNNIGAIGAQPTNSTLTQWSTIATNNIGAIGAQPTNANLTAWGSVTTASKENQSANLDNWSLIPTNNIGAIGAQPTNSNLTAWAALATSAKENQSANLDNWSLIATNNIGQIGAQPTNANLTAWAALATSAKENQSANLDNWSTIATNNIGAIGAQPTNSTLTQWSTIATNNIGAIGAQPTNSLLTQLGGIGTTNNAPGALGAQPTNSTLTKWSTIATNNIGAIGAQPTNSILTQLTGIGTTNNAPGALGAQPTNSTLTQWSTIATNNIGAIGAQPTNSSLTVLATAGTNNFFPQSAVNISNIVFAGATPNWTNITVLTENWNNLSAWTVEGSNGVWAVSGNKLIVTGNAAHLDDYLKSSYFTMSQNWTATYSMQLASTNAGQFGLGFGIRSAANTLVQMWLPFQSSDLYGLIVYYYGNYTNMLGYNGSSMYKTNGFAPFNTNDTFDVTIKKRFNVYSFACSNRATHAVTKAYQSICLTNTTGALGEGGAGNFAFWAQGGTQAIGPLTVTIGTWTPVDFTLIGDSQTSGYGATGFAQSYAGLLSLDYHNTVVESASGANTSNALSATNEINSLSTSNVVIQIGVNDPAAGLTLAQTEANLTNLVGSISSTGTKFICMPTPHGNPTNDLISNFVRTNAWGAGVTVIDCYSPLTTAFGTNTLSSLLTTDGLHPNNNGHDILHTVIRAAVQGF